MPRAAAACGLAQGMREEGWRVFRGEALAGRSFADAGDLVGHEGSYQATQPSSKTLDVGSLAETAEASEAHFCASSLRNVALLRSCRVSRPVSGVSAPYMPISSNGGQLSSNQNIALLFQPLIDTPSDDIIVDLVLLGHLLKNGHVPV